MVALDGERSRQVEVLWGCDGDNGKESNSLFLSTHVLDGSGFLGSGL